MMASGHTTGNILLMKIGQKFLTGAKPWLNRWFGFGLNFLPKSRSSFFSKNDSCFSSVHNKCSQKIVLIRSWFSEK